MARVERTLPKITHRNARSGALTGAFCLLFVIEGVVLHIFLYPRSPALSILLALVNIATLIWIGADFAALGSATSSLDMDNLHLHVGRRVQGRIPVASIKQALLLSWRETASPGKDYFNAAVPVEPNVLLTFHQPVRVRLFGMIERPIGSLGLVVDQPEDLLSALIADTPAPNAYDLQSKIL